MMNLVSTEPLFWCLAVAGVLLTGISKSGFAGGAGVVAVPLMVFEIPLNQAVAIMLPLLLLMDVKTIVYYRQHASRKVLAQVMPAACLGIGLGGLMMGFFSNALLELVLALICILFACWQRLAPWLASLRGGGVFWGGLSGFTSTLIHAGGPPINIYLLGKGMPKSVWLATAAVFFGFMNLLKLLPYTLNGQWSEQVLLTSLTLMPAAWLGVWSGKRIQAWMNEALFNHACRGLLFCSGALLLIKVFG